MAESHDGGAPGSNFIEEMEGVTGGFDGPLYGVVYYVSGFGWSEVAPVHFSIVP